MKGLVNDIRVTKLGVVRINRLIDSIAVDDYHKTLLKAIKNNMPKNVSKSDCDMLENIHDLYKHIQ